MLPKQRALLKTHFAAAAASPPVAVEGQTFAFGGKFGVMALHARRKELLKSRDAGEGFILLATVQV